MMNIPNIQPKFSYALTWHDTWVNFTVLHRILVDNALLDNALFFKLLFGPVF